MAHQPIFTESCKGLRVLDWINKLVRQPMSNIGSTGYLAWVATGGAPAYVFARPADDRSRLCWSTRTQCFFTCKQEHVHIGHTEARSAARVKTPCQTGGWYLVLALLGLRA